MRWGGEQNLEYHKSDTGNKLNHMDTAVYQSRLKKVHFNPQYMKCNFFATLSNMQHHIKNVLIKVLHVGMDKFNISLFFRKCFKKGENTTFIKQTWHSTNNKVMTVCGQFYVAGRCPLFTRCIATRGACPSPQKLYVQCRDPLLGTQAPKKFDPSYAPAFDVRTLCY